MIGDLVALLASCVQAALGAYFVCLGTGLNQEVGIGIFLLTLSLITIQAGRS